MSKPRGRSKSPKDGGRLHLYIPNSLILRLQEIQKETHASSVTEVVKEALRLYSAALNEYKNGGVIFFRGEDGIERQLALFI